MEDMLEKADVRLWAFKGAELRLVEIGRETEAIYRHFPELRRGRPSVEADGSGARTRRRKRKLSAEARKRISDAVKARWARQKATDAAGETGTSQAPETASEATAVRPTATKPQAGRRGRSRKMSAAAKRRISAAAKARWTRFRAENRKRSRTRARKKK